ncbi:hypothetical protein AeMF1_012730 [Aphanomyces euteiches]|nr:hypothetical protein AeMF1_012730 [Aphanomyces euteiches]
MNLTERILARNLLPLFLCTNAEPREHYEGLQDIVVIADNAPCHSRLKNEVFEGEEFSEACLLKLSPYSPMMNRIENLWLSLKAKVKSLLRERLAAFMGPPPEGSTREEFRMSYLEYVASQSINGIVFFV